MISRAMIHCDDLLDELQAQVSDHIHLALIAEAVPVAEMHLDLAQFSAAQASIARELCDDG